MNTPSSAASKPYLADAMAFLDLPGKPIIAHPDLRLDLAHVTVAPPLPWDMDKLAPYIEKSVGEITKQNSARFPLALKKSSIAFAESIGSTAIVMGLQAPPIDLVLEFDLLFEQGIRVMQLWYQDENLFGGGFACPLTHLTESGMVALRILANNGIILDLSHAGHTTAREVLNYIRAVGLPLRVMVSHTGCYKVFPHIRNLPDDVLKGVVELGGVVGIYTLTFGLSSDDNSLAPFKEHLAHAIGICGVDNVVIGTDGAYQPLGDETAERAQFEKMRVMVDKDGLFNARYPVQPLETCSPRKMNAIDNSLFFSDFGVSENHNKIAGLNLKRFFESALPE